MDDAQQRAHFKLTADLIDRALALTKLVVTHQAYIFALHAYLEELPGYNAVRWSQLREKYETQGVEGMQRDAQKAHDAVLALLKDFEGPIQ
jgi:hypothetical protein